MKLKLLFILVLFYNTAIAQNVIIVVIDGARYTETFGAIDPSINTPRMWNDLRPLGTYYENFRNDGTTVTNPGHSTILTGTWQSIANDGTERPTKPTVFEYFREEKSAALSDNYVVAGKQKLNILNYSDDPNYGSEFMASKLAYDITDQNVYDSLVSVMDNFNPSLILVNFPEVDRRGHSGVWEDYIAAIKIADSLVYQLWNKIQNDANYQDNTTLFITNDHGRHTTDFTSHGDDCEGCRHLMLLALGRNVTAGNVIPETKYMIDIAPTIGDLLSFSTNESAGTSLFVGVNPLPVEIKKFGYSIIDNKTLLTWETRSEIDNYGFEIEKKNFPGYDSFSAWQKIGFVEGHGNSNSVHEYSFSDFEMTGGQKFKYRLKQIDFNGMYKYSNELEVTISSPEYSVLEQNFPNPFNPSTTINFSLPEASFVSLKIFDVLGRLVQVLVNQDFQSGNYRVNFNAASSGVHSSGIYFYTLITGSFSQSKKMLLMQ